MWDEAEAQLLCGRCDHRGLPASSCALRSVSGRSVGSFRGGGRGTTTPQLLGLGGY